MRWQRFMYFTWCDLRKIFSEIRDCIVKVKTFLVGRGRCDVSIIFSLPLKNLSPWGRKADLIYVSTYIPRRYLLKELYFCYQTLRSIMKLIYLQWSVLWLFSLTRKWLQKSHLEKTLDFLNFGRGIVIGNDGSRLLGCYTMLLAKYFPVDSKRFSVVTFSVERSKVTLQMKTVRSLETWATIHPKTWRRTPKHTSPQQHNSENLKSRNTLFSLLHHFTDWSWHYSINDNIKWIITMIVFLLSGETFVHSLPYY